MNMEGKNVQSNNQTLDKANEFLLELLEDLNNPDATMDELKTLALKAEASSKVAKIITENAKTILDAEKTVNETERIKVEKAKLILQAEKLRTDNGVVYDENAASAIGISPNKSLQYTGGNRG